jgi:translation initiation factor 2 alpha subunit (eIF-2alpha)
MEKLLIKIENQLTARDYQQMFNILQYIFPSVISFINKLGGSADFKEIIPD